MWQYSGCPTVLAFVGRLVVMFRGSHSPSDIDHLIRRVEYLESLVEQLAQVAGVPTPELPRPRDFAEPNDSKEQLAHDFPDDPEPGITAEVRQRLNERDKVGAIKAYRVATGAGLIAAKRAIDSYAAHGYIA